MNLNDSMTEAKPDMFHDRRAFRRVDLEIACKLRRSANAAFSCGKTTDFSFGGAGIEIFGPREAYEGERIALAFENLRCPVTRAAKMIGARIVRAGPVVDGRQHVAVKFDSLQMGLEGLKLPTKAA